MHLVRSWKKSVLWFRSDFKLCVYVVFIFGKCWEYKPCIKQELELWMEFCEGGRCWMTVAMV